MVIARRRGRGRRSDRCRVIDQQLAIRIESRHPPRVHIDQDPRDAAAHPAAGIDHLDRGPRHQIRAGIQKGNELFIHMEPLAQAFGDTGMGHGGHLRLFGIVGGDCIDQALRVLGRDRVILGCGLGCEGLQQVPDMRVHHPVDGQARPAFECHDRALAHAALEAVDDAGRDPRPVQQHLDLGRQRRPSRGQVTAVIGRRLDLGCREGQIRLGRHRQGHQCGDDQGKRDSAKGDPGGESRHQILRRGGRSIQCLARICQIDRQSHFGQFQFEFAATSH